MAERFAAARTLAVVGAGPKGIAIAAKARALAAAGLGAPRVVLVDRGAVAGNWNGRQGYTSGSWSQPMEAIGLRLSPGLSARRSSANTSAGVLNPSIARGRSFISSATACR